MVFVVVKIGFNISLVFYDAMPPEVTTPQRMDRVSSRFSTGTLIKVCIAFYTGITLYAVFLKAQWQFWLLAVLVGMFQGGIQALSRSYLGKLIPPERSGEYYGLMDTCGKGASFMGTTLVAAISQVTRSENLGVGSLVVVFILGFFLFCKADKLNRS